MITNGRHGSGVVVVVARHDMVATEVVVVVVVVATWSVSPRHMSSSPRVRPPRLVAMTVAVVVAHDVAITVVAVE
jgi:hypothetical protein